MLGLTHPGQVEQEPAGTNPRMWGLTQLPSYSCSGSTGSSWGPSSLCKVHFSWELHLQALVGWNQLWRCLQMPVLGPHLLPAGCLEQHPHQGGFVLWCSSSLEGRWEFGSCLQSLQTGNVLREAMPRDPEVSLVTGTTCSRQHRTRRP